MQEDIMKNREKKAGFTLIEVVVAIASSSIILGGFLIAFSSLNKVGKQSDKELRTMSNAINARMMIKKVLSDADVVRYANISDPACCSGSSFDVLYYYKYDSSMPLGSQELQEYGFFYVDQQRTTDASYDSYTQGDTYASKNLYYQKKHKSPGDDTFPKNEEAVGPGQFDYWESSRYTVLMDVADFHANVQSVEPDVALGNMNRRFNIDYQITAAYETGSGTGADTGAGTVNADRLDTRSMVYKGSTYVMGRVTNHG
jgi:prepilin-type N-terminal cleavage/methylation domain-containing protein